MNSFKEFFLSFIESAKDRLKNPMIGAFVLAWIATNWRFISILFFSKKSIEDKIDFIEEKYFDIDYNLWIPLAVAVFYVLILPYLIALFDWLSQKGINARKVISKNHKILDIQNRQEIAAEEWQLEKIREGSPDISALKEEILELKSTIKEKDNLINSLSENLDSGLSENEENKGNSKENNTTKEKVKRPSRKKPTQKSTTTTDKTEPQKVSTHSDKFPIMKDIVIRDLAKTEREWILIYALYSSDFGKKVFTREDLMAKYSESNRKTDSRFANLSNNIKNMIKSHQIKFINDNDMLLTSSGIEMATEILNR